jgi:hypothetical protein
MSDPWRGCPWFVCLIATPRSDLRITPRSADPLKMLPSGCRIAATAASQPSLRPPNQPELHPVFRNVSSWQRLLLPLGIVFKNPLKRHSL